MQFLQTSYGYDIYELSRSESFMRGRNNRQFVAFVSGENFDTVGAAEIESKSFAEVLNYCEKYRVDEITQKQESPTEKEENNGFLKDYSYCPSENAGYTIIKHNVIDDIDGTKLGTVLGRNANGGFVTWEYNYFPDNKQFSGFNNGHYFNGSDGEPKAELNYYRRIVNRMEMRNAALESMQPEQNEESVDEGFEIGD